MDFQSQQQLLTPERMARSEVQAALSHVVRGAGLPSNGNLNAQINSASGMPRPLAPDPFNPDYDMHAFTLANPGVVHQPGAHYTDAYKLTNHPTFSDQSQYSQPGQEGGSWLGAGQDNYVFQPSELNMQNRNVARMRDYFQNQERSNAAVALPDGTYARGTR